MKILNHTKLVLKHKAYVFKHMFQCGYFWRGLLHDNSKFSPAEFLESIIYYQGNRSPIEAAKEEKGYSDAWMHHFHRNKHHSSYWIDCSFGEVRKIKMPWKYLIEHICDNVAAGKVYLGKSWTNSSPLDYYNSKDVNSFYNWETRCFLLMIYNNISEIGWDKTAYYIKHNKSLRELYENINEQTALDIVTLKLR